MPWYAVHTRSRHEEKVYEGLIRKSLHAFLPKVETWSRRKDRRKRIFLPMFSGYLFVDVAALDNQTKLDILKTPGNIAGLDPRAAHGDERGSHVAPRGDLFERRGHPGGGGLVVDGGKNRIEIAGCRAGHAVERGARGPLVGRETGGQGGMVVIALDLKIDLVGNVVFGLEV